MYDLTFKFYFHLCFLNYTICILSTNPTPRLQRIIKTFQMLSEVSPHLRQDQA
jgi:hypothetical protein